MNDNHDTGTDYIEKPVSGAAATGNPGPGVETLLTIAGSDPGGGAGIQADLRVFGHYGFYGLSVLTAVTAQNTQAVDAVYPLKAEQVAAQLQSVLADFRPVAVKTGMLAEPEIVEMVAAAISEGRTGTLVVDPVLASSAGPSLSSRPGRLAARLAAVLLPACYVVTPNLAEAAALTGRPVETLKDARTAARLLVEEMGAGAACVTGGHLSGEPTDVVYDGVELETVPGKRIAGGPFHGTGCLFSAALAANLARGYTLMLAVTGAKDLTETAISQAAGPGGGMRIPWLAPGQLEPGGPRH